MSGPRETLCSHERWAACAWTIFNHRVSKFSSREKIANRRKFVELAANAPLAGTSLPRDDAAPAKPLVVLPHQAHVYDTGRGETRILVGGEQTAGSWWLGSFVSEPGRKTSLHVHYSAEEQFYVVEGILSAWIDDKWLDLPAGSVATAPRKVPHALGNRSKEPVNFWWPPRVSCGAGEGVQKTRFRIARPATAGLKNFTPAYHNSCDQIDRLFIQARSAYNKPSWRMPD
jgi:quercetin dioxygenase-like cupin family protein